MIRTFSLIVVALAMAVPAIAQTTVLPANSEIYFRTVEPIARKNVRVGDAVRLVVTKSAIDEEGRILVAEGTEVFAEIHVAHGQEGFSVAMVDFLVKSVRATDGSVVFLGQKFLVREETETTPESPAEPRKGFGRLLRKAGGKIKDGATQIKERAWRYGAVHEIPAGTEYFAHTHVDYPVDLTKAAELAAQSAARQRQQ